ncbi:MAG: M48 family metalloprotease [Cyanobacteria bacterium P01_F01_bin.53]
MFLLRSQWWRWTQVWGRWPRLLVSLLCGLLLVLSCELAWSQPVADEVVGDKAVAEEVVSEEAAAIAVEDGAETVDLTVYVTHKDGVSFYLSYYPTELDWSEVDVPGSPENPVQAENPILPEGLPEAFRDEANAATLTQAMQTMMGCSSEDVTTSFDYGFYLSGHCPALTSAGFRWGDRMNLAPLLSALKAAQIDNLQVSLQLPDVGTPVVNPPVEGIVEDPLGNVEKTLEDEYGTFGSAWMDRFFPTYETYNIDVANPALTQIDYSYGFGRWQVLLRGIGLGLALLLPVGLFVWLRGRVLRLHAQSTDSTLWFGYQRSVAWIEIATWAVWFMLFFGTAASDWFPLLLPSAVSAHPLFGVVVAPLVIVPPMLVGLASRMLSYPVMKEIGQLDYTLPEILAQYVAFQGVIILPTLFFPSLELFDAGYGVLARVLLVGIVIVFLISIVAIKRLQDMTPYAITTGELRDRLFALAKPAGVKLQNIYLLPMRRSRMVNAFAVKNNTVMVTDYLLKQLSKDEVDAIMAHELAHLQLGHPRKLLWQLLMSLVVCSFGLALVFQLLLWFVPWLDMFQIPLIVAISLGWFYSTSRRFEYQADAQAALMTGNPQALMGGLVKVARLNRTPLQWGKLSESMMTHPSMQRRVMAIAERYDVSAAEVDVLLAEASDGAPVSSVSVDSVFADLSDDCEVADGERYDVNLLDPVGETLPLFSSEFKQKVGARLGWLIILGFAVAAVFLGRLVHLLSTPGLQWLGYGLAAVSLGCLYRYFLNVAPVWGYGTLADQLAERLRSQGFTPEDGQFVGFAPCDDERAELKSYEGHCNWDVGFLFVREARLCYIGEQLKFALSPSQLTRVTVKTDTASLVPSSTVAITWQDEQLASHTFTLQPLTAKSVMQTTSLSTQLQATIETWQAEAGQNSGPNSGGSTHALFEALTPPVLGNVTSQSLLTFSAGMVVSTWLVFVVIACAIAAMTGSLFLSWPLTGFILLMATAAAGSQCWPPLYRARQAKATAVA